MVRLRRGIAIRSAGTTLETSPPMHLLPQGRARSTMRAEVHDVALQAAVVGAIAEKYNDVSSDKQAQIEAVDW